MNYATEFDGDDDALFNMNYTWQKGASTFTTLREAMGNSAVDHECSMQEDWLLLDNQADISIINPKFLQDIEDCNEVRVNGIGGLSIKVNKTGHLDGVFRVHAMANVSSFAQVEDLFEMTYLK